MSNDIIRGRRLTDLESHIFNEWQGLNFNISEEELNEIIDKLIAVPNINPIPLQDIKMAMNKITE